MTAQRDGTRRFPAGTVCLPAVFPLAPVSQVREAAGLSKT